MVITALFGNPTSHSISPRLFSIYAKEHDLEHVHLKIDVQSGRLFRALEAAKILGFKGLNITLPYKSDVVKYLDEIDPQAQKIGAVNTIVIKGKKLYGYNTDMYGATRAIEERLKRKINHKDKSLVIGTGGAARAITQGLLQKGSHVIVCYREPKSSRTISIMRDFNKEVEFIKNSAELVKLISEVNVICNATSAGMLPHTNELPLKRDYLIKASAQSDFSQKLFFDAIFNPYQTLFLRIAKKRGATIQGGAEMMVHQGVIAFELWTGLRVSKKSIDFAKKALRSLLFNK